jgi:hypothetical protein
VDTRANRLPTLAALLILVPLCAPGLAQRRLELQFGIQAGVPITRTFESSIRQATARETVNRAWGAVGPTFEAVLFDRVLMQVDALYKPLRASRQNLNPASPTRFDFRAASFEFPVILDLYLSKDRPRPYAGGGVVVGHIFSGTTRSSSTGPGGETPFEGQFFLSNQLPAFVANGGFEWNTARVAIRPELRYTRWSSVSGLRMGLNQVEVSVGFSMRGR